MTAKKKTTSPPALAVSKPAKKLAGKARANTAPATAVGAQPTDSRAVAAPTLLLSELRELIVTSRQSVAQVVNSALATLYWEIGRRIRQDVLKSKRAGYGEQIVAAIGRQLERDLGRGFGQRNLFRMIRFAEVFPDIQIVSALRTQLGWTHFKAIIPMADPLKREFCAEMCRIERWSICDDW
jgi:hypothetical protein